ncbi:MAG: CocE/NonD family hydrolase [Cyanobacteria bacterium RI_101]|nr:CocE/NonD family hydrolase [Cyanobacteria bacterium RI_101]
MPLPIRQDSVYFYTRDSVRLDADLYYPDTEEPLPALLMRQPYGRKIASTVVYAHPRWYAQQGYLVAIQDVRGRGTSEGEFRLFEAEIEDGADTLEWLANLPQCNGVVGMYGFSYQGMTQLYSAVSPSPYLKALCPAMMAWDLRRDWAYENDAFCWQSNLTWALQLEMETARRRGDVEAYQALKEAFAAPGFNDPVPVQSEVLKTWAPESFYWDWLRDDGDYWRALSPCHLLPSLSLPTLQIGGWFDPHLRGNLALYQALKERNCPQKLIIGPWGHLPWGRRGGQKDYGPDAVSPVDQWQIDWFNAHLKGQTSAFSESPPLRLFEMGPNQWLNLEDFPEGRRTWFLSAQGLAAIRGGDLRPEPGLTSADTWVHDPTRPLPALGGHGAIPGGAWERGHLDSRTDILTYTSAPLTAPLRLCGAPQVFLWVESDGPSFDLSVILAEVSPQGAVWPLAQTYGVFEGKPGVPKEITLTLQAVCAQLSPGSALRLSLGGAAFPAYPVNPGTGDNPRESPAIERRVLTFALYSGEDYPATLVLPSLD